MAEERACDVCKKPVGDDLSVHRACRMIWREEQRQRLNIERSEREARSQRLVYLQAALANVTQYGSLKEMIDYCERAGLGDARLFLYEGMTIGDAVRNIIRAARASGLLPAEG